MKFDRRAFNRGGAWGACMLLCLAALACGTADGKDDGAADGKDGGAKKLTLDDLFPTDRVLDIQIEVSSQDWNTLRHQTRNGHRGQRGSSKPFTYVPARVTIDGVQFPNVAIRKKGFIGSISSSRPSLKVKLNYTDKEANIGGLNLLTLNNNKQDPSQIDQYLGYRLFNEAGSPAPRCAFAEVSVNGRSLGVYSHVEGVRSHFLKQHFGDNGGVLYEGTTIDFHPGSEHGFEHERGDDALGKDRIRQLSAVLTGSNPSAIEIGNHIDLDSFYKFWALEGLIGFGDGYTGNMNNYFFYLNPATDKFHFIPWGADASFRKYSHVEGRDPSAPISVKMRGAIANALYQTQEGREGYRKAMLELLNKRWNEEAMAAEIDRVGKMIEPYLNREQRNAHNEVGGRRGFRGELEDVRSFILTRRGDIMGEIAGGMPIWSHRSSRGFHAHAAHRAVQIQVQPQQPQPPQPPQLPNTGIWRDARMGDVKAAERRIAHGADVNERDRMYHLAPLGWAAIYGQTEVARALLDNGADVNIIDRSGNTPLHTAAFLGDVETAKLLIENGANIRAKNHEGNIPAASTNAPFEITSFIGAVFQIKIDRRRFGAIEKGRKEIIQLLNSQ